MSTNKTSKPPADHQPAETEHQITVPHKYLHLQQGEGKPLLLLVHGFADSGPGFLRRVAPILSERFELLAPNGLFPQPVKHEDRWKEAYAWYFADLAARKFYVHPDVSARALASLVRKLGLENRPKVLLGFSQGGWFLPYLAKELQYVEKMIMIGSGFRAEDFSQFGLELPVFALHGAADEVVPALRSQEEFAQLGSANKGGTFTLVPGMTHTIDDQGRAYLKELLDAYQS